MKTQHTPKKKPTAIDLFSGCGGLTLGLKQAGFRVIGAVDNDGLAVSTYSKNHPGVNVWNLDIRELSVSHVMDILKLKPHELDLLAGCPPCQGFSSMRTLSGKLNVSDPRNELVFDFLRFVKELMPRAIMMENVPGLAKDRRMSEFIEALKQLGYESNCTVLNAADYGVPQRRRRMILISAGSVTIDFAKKDTERKTVRETIAHLPLPGASGDPLHDAKETRTKRIAELFTRIPKDGGSRMDMGEEYQLECHKKCSGFTDVYGRMAWNDVSPTITGGCSNPSKGRFLHPEHDRAITLREAALLQSFPQDYFFSLERGKTGAALMIGNALPPEFIRRQAKSIIDALNLTEKRSAK